MRWCVFVQIARVIHQSRQHCWLGLPQLSRKEEFNLCANLTEAVAFPKCCIKYVRPMSCNVDVLHLDGRTVLVFDLHKITPAIYTYLLPILFS